MSKLTLLEIVQDIANDLDSDPINSINDTVESVQIAQIVKSTFFELIANRNWPHLKKTHRLYGISDVSRPVYLTLPENTKEVLSVSYNKRKTDDLDKDRYERLIYMDPVDFLDYTNKRDNTKDVVERVADFGGAQFLIYTDRQPTYYTSFDDDKIVFDSYDSAIESTISNSFCQAVIYETPQWTPLDDHKPNLPEEAFPLLVEESKSTAFIVLKQESNSKAEQKAQRQQRWLSRKAWRVSGGVRYPDYGRRI